ncbi:kelch-like protein 10 [Asbolus verrucosus]|uniref:Kelch-like protein diablo n=1 Tax=Asbolus verrucosus TaxID=1661398 RepID=A0A482W041_ASBVE|nr:kelch-like protein 10 [Asbolus verrucosus]
MFANSKNLCKKRKQDQNCSENDECVCMPFQLSSFDFPPIWKELHLKNQLCDGIVHCDDGTEFKIHRAILAAASPYFRALFTNSINRGQPEVHEANVSVPSEIFTLLLDFAYTGEILINSSNVENLLKFADRYEILGVVQLCCSYLLEEMCSTNCLGILNFASQYFCNDLVIRGQRFVKYNFTKVLLESSEFVYLDKNELAEIITDDELNIKSEEIVFDAVIKWINFSPENRKIHFFDLLKCVRIGTMSQNCLASIAKHPFIEEKPECKEYIAGIVAATDSMVCTGDVDISNIIFRPRLCHDVLFAIGGWSTGSPTNFVETYDVRANRWLLSSDTDSMPRAYHGLCELNGIIYVIGGFDGNQYFNTVRRFDPVNHTWNECACMYHHRCYVSAVTFQNKIYALGGYNGRTRMNTAERYDPVKNQWEIIPPMQKPRSDASAVVLNDKIYIVGGFNGQEVMRSAEVFNIKTNQWTYIPEMISARSGVSLVVFNNTLYALGGFNGYQRLRSGEKFIPGETSWWTEIPEMITPRSNFATVVLDDHIYVIGGFNDNFVSGFSTMNLVEYYNPKTNGWSEAPPMNLNRSALRACVISGLPNAKEYSILGRSQEEWEERAEADTTQFDQ